MINNFLKIDNKLLFYFIILSILFFYFFVEIKIPILNYALARPYTLFIFLFLLFLFIEDYVEIFKNYTRPLILFAIFILINLISLIFNYQGIKSLEGFFHIVLVYLIFPITLLLFKEEINFSRFIKILIIISYLLFFINIIFLFLPSIYQKLWAHSQSYPRLGSLFQHPVFYGAFSVITYIILLTNRKLFSKDYLYYLSIIVNSLALVMSGAKLSFILYLLFSFIILYYLYFKNKDYATISNHLLIIISTSLLFYLFWLSPQNIILSKITYEITKKEDLSNWIRNFYIAETYQETSINRRIQIWKIVLSKIFENPINLILGHGPFYLGKIMTPHFTHTHNILLEFLLSYGLIGLIYLIIVTICIFKRLFKIKNFMSNLIFLYFLIHSLFDILFFNGILDFVFYSFLTKIIYYNEKNSNKSFILG
jgi:O-antigen ligase